MISWERLILIVKTIITILLTLISVVAIAAGAVIYNALREDDTEIPNGITEEENGTDAAPDTEPVKNAGVDLVTIAVTFGDGYTSQPIITSLIHDDEPVAGGIINFTVTFDDADNNPFIYNIPVSDSVIDGDSAFSIVTFIFTPDSAGNNAIPYVTFIPGHYNAPDYDTPLLATYFVAFDDASYNANPYMFIVPIPGGTADADDNGVDSFAVTFIVTLGDAAYDANRFLPDSTSPADSGASRGERGIRVLADEDLSTILLGTWIYRSRDTHVEMTFLNDWRYYEISYAPSGRPLTWEYGVYSIEDEKTITIQSSSIWGPTYTYDIKIDNNVLTFSYRGVNYTFNRQNRLPILTFENFPYSLWQTWERTHRGRTGENGTEDGS
jgi:hypothetical protein